MKTDTVKVELSMHQVDALLAAAGAVFLVRDGKPEEVAKAVPEEKLIPLNQSVEHLMHAVGVRQREDMVGVLEAAGIKPLAAPKDKSGVRFKCRECENEWGGKELRPVSRLDERVQGGESVPGGECPGCGGLCDEVGGTTMLVLMGGTRAVHGVALVSGASPKDLEQAQVEADTRYNQLLAVVPGTPTRLKEYADLILWLKKKNGEE